MRRTLLLLAGLFALAIPSHAHTNEPWKASVRVKIEEGNNLSIGSGTVIYSHTDGRAWILTCAHVFGRGSDPGSFSRRITIDLFDGEIKGQRQQMGFVESFVGRCIDFDPVHDVGLIVIKPGRTLEETRPSDRTPAIGEKLVSVGCPGGADATAWSTVMLREIHQADGYEGIECKHEPPQGRSGGGLFLLDGHIVGVCDFASPQTKTGIYAAPVAIKGFLSKNGLAWLYETAARPQKQPEPPGPPTPSASPPAVPPATSQASGGFRWDEPLHLVAAAVGVLITFLGGSGGVAAIIVVAIRMARQAPAAPAEDLDPFTKLFAPALLQFKTEEDKRKRAEEVAELAKMIKAAVSAPKEGPASAPGAG